MDKTRQIDKSIIVRLRSLKNVDTNAVEVTIFWGECTITRYCQSFMDRKTIMKEILNQLERHNADTDSRGRR